jgi:hypothetical protein
VSDRLIVRLTAVAIVVAATVRLALPDPCVPLVVAHFWFGMTLGIMSAFWPPPSGPDAGTTPKAQP